jgi:hypothetical protein
MRSSTDVGESLQALRLPQLPALAQGSANIPVDHPPHVYLNERPLHEAVVEFLSRGLLGPDRQTYWHRPAQAVEGPANLRTRR